MQTNGGVNSWAILVLILILNWSWWVHSLFTSDAKIPTESSWGAWNKDIPDSTCLFCSVGTSCIFAQQVCLWWPDWKVWDPLTQDGAWVREKHLISLTQAQRQRLGCIASQLMKMPAGAKNNPEFGSSQQRTFLLMQPWQAKNNHSKVNVLSTSAQNLCCKETNRYKRVKFPSKDFMGKNLDHSVPDQTLASCEGLLKDLICHWNINKGTAVKAQWRRGRDDLIPKRENVFSSVFSSSLIVESPFKIQKSHKAK